MHSAVRPVNTVQSELYYFIYLIIKYKILFKFNK